MKKILTIGIMLLFVGMTIAPTSGINLEKQSSVKTLDGNTLYVGGSGPGNYTRIQDAIDNASDGDTAFVYDDSSPYNENIIINKSLILIGENKETTIIDGNNSGDVVYISADYVNISGFKIQNSGNYDNGIWWGSHSNNIITGNIISNNGDGIWFYSSSRNTITGNIIEHTGCAIHSSHSRSNTIAENIISNNYYGILLFNSSDNTIMSNSINSNRGSGIYLSGSSSSYNIVMSNNISKNKVGIWLFSDWSYDYSISNTLTGNIISNNEKGIVLFRSISNIIEGNIISNNENGLELYTTKRNIIFHNNFINNTRNAYDECNNSWDNGYPSCGNYWSDYSGIDNFSGKNQNILGQDGVGDTPYDLPCEYATDWYPLMEPYGMTKLSFIPGSRFPGLLKNIGNKTAFNVHWKITIDGGIILLGRESSGTIPKPLLPGEETTVNSKLVFGFGRIMITVAVWADNVLYVSGTISGFLLLFFLLLNPGGCI